MVYIIFVKGGEGMKLRLLREKQGISVATLATIMGVAVNTVSRWETGNREPGLNTIKKLAEVLNCTVDELLSDGPHPMNSPSRRGRAKDTKAA